MIQAGVIGVGQTKYDAKRRDVSMAGLVREAIDNGATSILLDNFTLQSMRDAVRIAEGKALLEASGGITLDSIVTIAETGVDRISIGALTKDIEAIDLSMRLTFNN